MGGRNWIYVAAAVVLGLLAVIIANSWFSGIEEKQEQIAAEQRLERIVVASQDMEFGTPLTQQNVRLQNFPAAAVPAGAFRSIPEALKNGRVALRPIVVGEPVLASKVSGSDGRATLAAILPEGMRAYSMAMSAESGVAGFVLPGTVVDVILTRQIAGDGAGAEDQRSDVILEGAQVMAVDQLASDKEGQPKVSSVATLAVTIADAQRLAIAKKIGTLSLALRRIEDRPGEVAASGSGGTVTNRQLGGARLAIRSRGGGGGGGASAPQPTVIYAGMPPAAAAVGNAANAFVPNGPTMTVVRGTEAQPYSVTALGRW